MLGEQIAELKGKITGQRVLDAEGPNMEITISAKGSFKVTQVIDTLTFVSRPSTEGVVHGRGCGVLISVGSPGMATYTGQGVGRISSSGATKWLGAHFYRTSSNGKLAFLNNIVAILEAEIDTRFSREDLGMEVIDFTFLRKKDAFVVDSFTHSCRPKHRN